MYNMKTTEFEQFGLCNFFRTIVLKHAELAKEELNWITTSVARAHHTCVAAGWIPGHWIHNAPNQQQILCGHHIKKRPETANNKHLMEYDCEAIYTKAQSGSARNSHSNRNGSRISRVTSVAENFMEACLESI
jgi:hypothetical protein